MFKKISFKGLNYKELDRLESHDIKRDELSAFYSTFDFLDLIEKWPEIVGTKLCTVTSPLKIKNDSLFIVTKHSSYSHELSFLTEPIKIEIFRFFPHLAPIIKKIVFQTNEVFFNLIKNTGAPDTTPLVTKLHPQNPKYKLIKAEAEKTFSDVEDEELKKDLISIYIQTRNL